MPNEEEYLQQCRDLVSPETEAKFMAKLKPAPRSIFEELTGEKEK